jgi:endonuclease G
MKNQSSTKKPRIATPDGSASVKKVASRSDEDFDGVADTTFRSDADSDYFKGVREMAIRDGFAGVDVNSQQTKSHKGSNKRQYVKAIADRLQENSIFHREILNLKEPDKAKLFNPTKGTPSRKEMELEADAEPEAVVMLGRQSLLVANGTIENPWSYQVKSNLLLHIKKINAAIRAVGGVIVPDYSPFPVGTAWAIGDHLVITNRHVAKAIVNENGKTITKKTFVNFLGEYKSIDNDSLVYAVEAPVYIASNNEKDYALFRLRPRIDGRSPSTVRLFDQPPTENDEVLTIGFPAKPGPQDPANDSPEEQAENEKIFAGVYYVKRAAPGLIVKVSSDKNTFIHDCTTLPGSSGSVVIHLKTGAAVGLHYGGFSFDEEHPGNYAVSSQYLLKHLDQLDSLQIARPISQPKEDVALETSIKTFVGRNGYNPNFLGEFEVNLPTPNSNLMKSVVLPERDGDRRTGELPYTNFSVVMHKQRRMAPFTAVNLDGSEAVQIKRKKDVWYYDSRVPTEQQIGEDFYKNNEFDFGHLVRRLDPVWGDDAEQAEKDTFVLTNCSPQWSTFNRKLWLGLEDYVLNNAKTMGFKACIFAGPIFHEEDPEYRGVQVPRAYWKIAVMLETETRNPVAVGYTISQAELIAPFLEFAFGEYKTYQVPIALIESRTGLSFGNLTLYDPLGKKGQQPPKPSRRRPRRRFADELDIEEDGEQEEEEPEEESALAGRMIPLERESDTVLF